MINGVMERNTSTPDNPAVHAKQVWDEREGKLLIRNKNLRKFVFALLGLVAVLVCSLAYVSTQIRVVPYIVEVDKSTGEIKAMGDLRNIDYQPGQLEITYFLREFISNVRGIPLDRVVYADRWNRAYKFLTEDAQNKMTSVIQSEKSFENFGKKTIVVNILSINPFEGGNSYHVNWEEQEFLIGSGAKKVTPMSGVFTVKILPVEKDKEILNVNPLGLFITDFSWQIRAVGSQNVTQGNKPVADNSNNKAVNTADNNKR